MHLPRILVSLLVLTFFGSVAIAQTPAPPGDLTDYVFKNDGAFEWKMNGKAEEGVGTVYTIDLTSQNWQGINWTHKLQIIIPKGVSPQKTMLLWNQGGTPSGSSTAIAMALAMRIKAPVAFLFGIPNQPIEPVGGSKKEDALIAETFVRFLKTGDSTWPLLFPMVKSMVKTMDTIQAFAKKEWKFDVTHFVVTGASKRGWTSWLTAATGDPRVKAIAPLVIDTLNFQAQMPNQLKSFNGKYSVMIHDYEERNLLPLPDTTEARKLWAMVDPWIYRERITVPKMVINGTNDPYWAQDALNLYWDDLVGEKYVLYVPNAGHDLREMETPNRPSIREAKRELFPNRGINTLAAFAKHQITDTPLPQLTWKHSDVNGTPTLMVESSIPAKQMRGWVAESPTRDFREAKWKALEPKEPLTKSGKLTIAKADKNFTAFFGEAEYEIEGLSYTLSTQIRILEPAKE